MNNDLAIGLAGILLAAVVIVTMFFVKDSNRSDRFRKNIAGTAVVAGIIVAPMLAALGATGRYDLQACRIAWGRGTLALWVVENLAFSLAVVLLPVALLAGYGVRRVLGAYFADKSEVRWTKIEICAAITALLLSVAFLAVLISSLDYADEICLTPAIGY